MGNKEFTFVHIGKCAGSSIWHSINSKNLELAKKTEYLHLNRLNLSSGHKYIIILRNPIKRFISAFYWRYALVVDSDIQRKRFKKEYQNLLKWKTVENFVRDIEKNGEWIFRGKQNSGSYIHQVHQDIYYYLAPLVDSENSNRVKCVLTQENIKEDMKNLLDIELNIHHHNNSSLEYDKYLSKKSIQTLKEVLSPDYYCIEKLYEWNALTDKQYNLLLNDK